MRKPILGIVLMLGFITAWSQTTVKGRLVDQDTNEPLIGATVQLKGTTKGTITDLNGEFSLNAENGQILVISYVGYVNQEITVNGADLGDVSMESDAIGLEGLEVIASFAEERKTPVAVSTVTAAEIVERASNQEFPELLKSTPGVYTSRAGGGYGDSRINLRGFDDVNVAVLINGIPVNDMENGRIYWSNWAGLTDVTRSMQVQRGLGASKVAVPSIGGTINIMTRTTDATPGGNIFYGVGNDNYQKASFSVASGLMDNGWAVSLSASTIQGDGWVDGTEFKGYNYFFNISKQVNDKHLLSFTGFGAPQRHGQRQNPMTISEIRNAPQGLKYNRDWGVKNGEIVHVEDNFYHKPQFSLNHYWTIDDKSELSTAVYMSFGTGGGGGEFGDFEPAENGYEPKNLDALVEINQSTQDGNALAFLRASRNDHEWYGMLSTYTRQINSKLNILAGVDLRQYIGRHFREITDLLGADYYLSNDDVNNPNQVIGVGDKYSYNNDGHVRWLGGFLQGEYTMGKLNTFATVSFSSTGYKRVDHFAYQDSDPLQETDYNYFGGLQIKGGANYNINQNHNIFANVGWFTKAPDFDAVYPGFDQFVNPAVVNQKIVSYELGYGYRSASFTANVNLYNTAWLDRTLTTAQTIDGEERFFSLLGVDALHQGIEVDFAYKPNTSLLVTGMVSIGDWRWANDVDGVTEFDDNQQPVEVFEKLYIKDLKVGDAAQTTAALGVSYEFFPGFKLGATANYFDDLYAEYDPTTRTGSESSGVQPFLLPSYATVDIRMKYDFDFGDNSATVFGNVNNVFNEEYIAESTDGSIDNILVYYGLGTTWTLGLKYNF